MTHIKCSQCGLVNWPTAERCERCGVQLERSEPETHAPEPVRPDFPILTYGSDASRSSTVFKLIMVVVVALAIGGAVWAVWFKRGSGARRSAQAAKKQFVPPTLDERTRDALLSCIAQPGFSGTKIAEQVLGKVKLELLQVPDQEVYFSAPAPEKVGEGFESMIARFLIDPKRIVMAEDDGAGRLQLGKYSLLRFEDKHLFFKTPIDNIKFDPATVLKFRSTAQRALPRMAERRLAHRGGDRAWFPDRRRQSA